VSVAAQQLDRCYKQGVVGKRAEKLRCHDGEKTALHGFLLCHTLEGARLM
jgi:hypothetical protein